MAPSSNIRYWLTLRATFVTSPCRMWATLCVYYVWRQNVSWPNVYIQQWCVSRWIPPTTGSTYGQSLSQRVPVVISSRYKANVTVCVCVDTRTAVCFVSTALPAPLLSFLSRSFFSFSEDVNAVIYMCVGRTQMWQSAINAMFCLRREYRAIPRPIDVGFLLFYQNWITWVAQIATATTRWL